MDYLVLTKTGGMILGPISQILGWVMDALFRFTSSFGILNIGLCIILFTLVVKLLMFPLTIKQQRTAKITAVMQPELKAIQKKYKGKRDRDSLAKQDMEVKAVYEKYGASMTGGCLQLIIQLPILLALYRVIYNIPAYVSSVKDYFMQVIFSITEVSNAASLPEGAASRLVQFATDHQVSMKGLNAIGDLTGVTGEVLGNKMVDILYKLNPTQWIELEQTFPHASSIIAANSEAIEKMNSFLGINLATNPWQGFIPNWAWLIPIAAGLSQWYSSKLMMVNQPQSENELGAQMMKQMNVTMPLMSVFFCFTFPAAIGIYWVSSSVVQIIQQMVVNSYLNKVDIDEIIQQSIQKVNKKRAKKGLPPKKINQNVNFTLKNKEAVEEKQQAEHEEKLQKTKKQMEEAKDYYNKDEKPGSLSAKANMVVKYNEKHNK